MGSGHAGGDITPNRTKFWRSRWAFIGILILLIIVVVITYHLTISQWYDEMQDYSPLIEGQPAGIISLISVNYPHTTSITFTPTKNSKHTKSLTRYLFHCTKVRIKANVIDPSPILLLLGFHPVYQLLALIGTGCYNKHGEKIDDQPLWLNESNTRFFQNVAACKHLCLLGTTTPTSNFQVATGRTYYIYITLGSIFLVPTS